MLLAIGIIARYVDFLAEDILVCFLLIKISLGFSILGQELGN